MTRRRPTGMLKRASLPPHGGGGDARAPRGGAPKMSIAGDSRQTLNTDADPVAFSPASRTGGRCGLAAVRRAMVGQGSRRAPRGGRVDGDGDPGPERPAAESGRGPFRCRAGARGMSDSVPVRCRNQVDSESHREPPGRGHPSAFSGQRNRQPPVRTTAGLRRVVHCGPSARCGRLTVYLSAEGRQTPRSPGSLAKGPAQPVGRISAA